MHSTRCRSISAVGHWRVFSNNDNSRRGKSYLKWREGIKCWSHQCWGFFYRVVKNAGTCVSTAIVHVTSIYQEATVIVNYTVNVFYKMNNGKLEQPIFNNAIFSYLLKTETLLFSILHLYHEGLIERRSVMSCCDGSKFPELTILLMRDGWFCFWVQSCVGKSYMSIFSFFSAMFAWPCFVELQKFGYHGNVM